MPAIRCFPVLAATLAALTLATLAPAQRKVKLDKELKVKEWGYVIRPIEGFNAMPADQEDKFAVGRWKLGLDEFEKRGDYEAYRAGQYCEMRVIRIQQQAKTGEQKPAEEPKEKDESIRISGSLAKRYAPKSLNDWIEGNWDGAEKRWVRSPIKGKMSGELIEFGSGASAITIGYFERYGVEWAVVYTSFEENYRKTWREFYIKSIQSFNVVENVNPDVAAAAKKDITKLEGDEKREALHASIAGQPGWYAEDSDHYVFLSNAEDKAFVKKLQKELETLREKIYVPWFKPRNTKTPLSPVRVFNTQSEYHQYGGPGGSAGYFSPTKGELVLFVKFDGDTKSNSLDNCRSVAFHEGFHQYVHFAVGDVSPHSWFNEGHGDYFAGIKIAGTRLKVDTFDWRVDYLKDHLRGNRDLIPVRTLIRLPQSEYYSNAGLKYSQGWALIYYMRNVSKDKKHEQALETYFNYLADNVAAFREKKKDKDEDETEGETVPGIPGLRKFDFEDYEKVQQILSEAVDKAFADVDLEQLDKDLRAWVEKL